MPALPVRARGRVARWSRRAAALTLGVVTALVLAELALRAALFLPGDGPARWFAAARRPDLYAHGETDEYWKLHWSFLPREQQVASGGADPLLGWAWRIEPRTYRVHEPIPRDGRRPVVLYGDSFAQCTTPPEQCFQALLDESDLRERFRLVNLGAGGYGLDQIYLAIRATIDELSEHDPIVAVEVVVGQDPDLSLIHI